MSKIYIFVLSGLVKNKDMMESRTLVAIALATIIAVSVISYILPSASAHGVQAQLQSRFVRIDNEQFSDQTLTTGEDLTVTGELTSLVNRPLRAWLSLFSESANAGNRWEFLARDPPGNIFDIPPGATIPYSITVRALEPGTYHVHTQLNVEHVGPGLGRGATVSVTGEAILKPIPYSNIIYQCVIIGVGLGVTFATRPWQVI
ncbi:MAG: methane monooxygenase/ammonia monooxygenase subunit B [Thermoproteota archaeon]|nr:methane monooxygenase/ammonia monooxygenase subunit B [Thermoproteota archaeon]